MHRCIHYCDVAQTMAALACKWLLAGWEKMVGALVAVHKMHSFKTRTTFLLFINTILSKIAFHGDIFYFVLLLFEHFSYIRFMINVYRIFI